MSITSRHSLRASIGEHNQRKSSDIEKSNNEISRFGLHGFAGELERDGADPVTIQILEEINFLPRHVLDGDEDGDDDGYSLSLRAQVSRPPSSEYDDFTGGIGLKAQRPFPLKIGRVFGRPGHLPVFNLTGVFKSHVVYAASNVLVFFDYYANSQKVLQGHEDKISCIAKDPDSKYFATGDMSEDPMLLIWNARTGSPIKLFSNDSMEAFSAVRAVCFVGHGLDYIAAVFEVEDLRHSGVTVVQSQSANKAGRQRVSILHFGERQQRVSHAAGFPGTEIPELARRQTMIHFSSDVPTHFVTTGNSQVVFYTWLRRKKTIISHVPRGHMRFMKRFKRFTATIWVNDSVLTATASGYIVEWKAQDPLGFEATPNSRHNVKEFRRFVKIDQDVGLTALVAHKHFILVGDEEGGVRFLDNKFRLLRWTRTGASKCIRSIAFNCTDDPPAWKKELRSTYSHGGHDHNTFHRKGKSTVYDYTYGGGKYRIPSETTIERNPLHLPEDCLDLVVGYDDGSVAYFHIAEEKVDNILRETLGPDAIVAMDTCPTTKHIAISTLSGAMQIINYKTSEIIAAQKLFKKEVEVTCLRFHPSGSFFVLGSTSGAIYFRKTFTLGLKEHPLHSGKSPVSKIVFSSCGLYMGIFDNDMTVSVCVCTYNGSKGGWFLKAKHRSHYRPVVDITFFRDSIVNLQRFFSIGQDRRIVEYDLSQSNPTKGLKILSVTSVEQFAIPTVMAFDAPFRDHGPILLYSTTNNKIRMFDQDALKIRKTCQGPEFGAPLKNMVPISAVGRGDRNTRYALITLGNKIGLMKTPIDGNPFKYMAAVGHPTEIQDVGIGKNGSEFFTRAESDRCIFMWIPDVRILENHSMAGGLGVVPFERYLDAGLPQHLSIVDDIKNIFYHFMLKRAPNHDELLQMPLSIPLADITTVMRTMGHFPSELEIDMLSEEVEFILGQKYGKKQTEITFDDFVMLYVNHRDAGVHEEDIFRAFEILGEPDNHYEYSITRDNFVSLITTRGEALREADLPLFLPNFYQVPQISVVKEAIQWRYERSEASSTESSPRRLRSEALSMLEEDQHGSQLELPRVSNKSEVHEKPPSEQLSGGSDAPPEDFDGFLQREMVKNITAKFFIEHVLPEDVHGPLYLDRDEFTDDLNELAKITEEHPTRDAMKEIVKRWKGRDEWRYFKDAFEKLKHERIPMDQRLEVAMQLDIYFKNKLQEESPLCTAEDDDICLDEYNQVQKTSGETEFSYIYENKDVFQRPDVEDRQETQQLLHGENKSAESDKNTPRETEEDDEEEEDENKDEEEDEDENENEEEEEGENENEEEEEEDENENEEEEVEFGSEEMSSSTREGDDTEEEMEKETVEESDITNGTPISPPFTGILEETENDFYNVLPTHDE